MASDDKKSKAGSAPKTEASPKSKSTADAKSTSDAKSSADAKSTADAAPGKAEGGEKDAGSPSSYHRGEGQKPVSQAYRDNWNLIFGEKKKR